MKYEIGWHSHDQGVCHVALTDNEGKRDEIFDVQLYDPDVPEGTTNAREKSLAALQELVDRANAALDPTPLGDPPEHLADAWARYQAGAHVDSSELSKLDEWRADCAEGAGY